MIRERKSPSSPRGRSLAKSRPGRSRLGGSGFQGLEEAWRPQAAKVIGSSTWIRASREAGIVGRGILAAGADVAKVVGTPIVEGGPGPPGPELAWRREGLRLRHGTQGLPTRMLAGFGAWAVYAAPDFGPAAASGQIPVSKCCSRSASGRSRRRPPLLADRVPLVQSRPLGPHGGHAGLRDRRALSASPGGRRRGGRPLRGGALRPLRRQRDQAVQVVCSTSLLNWRRGGARRGPEHPGEAGEGWSGANTDVLA